MKHTKNCELGDNWMDCPACVDAAKQNGELSQDYPEPLELPEEDI